MAHKRLHWTRRTVLRKVRAVFPGSDPADILGTLKNGGAEGSRVQLAVMKLCDEGKGLSDLAHYVNTAKLDDRDVLAWAEEPHAIGLPATASDAEREEAEGRDLDAYLRWIKQDLKEKG